MIANPPMLTRRSLVAGLALTALVSPVRLAAQQSSGLVAGARSAAIWDSFTDYPYIRGETGRRVFVITRLGCRFTARMRRDWPTSPPGLDFAYVVIPSVDAPHRAYLRLFAEPTPAAFGQFMDGAWNGLPRGSSGPERMQFIDYVNRWRRIERALGDSRLRAVTPMFFWGTREKLEHYAGYERALVAYLQKWAAP
ncbi:MAG: hypothetical protein KKC79_16700 [Gammaproteobacteria bacterium]|nr:hypothetical protein [Gammaproteobacteria bacterium]